MKIRHMEATLDGEFKESRFVKICVNMIPIAENKKTLELAMKERNIL